MFFLVFSVEDENNKPRKIIKRSEQRFFWTNRNIDRFADIAKQKTFASIVASYSTVVSWKSVLVLGLLILPPKCSMFSAFYPRFTLFKLSVDVYLRCWVWLLATYLLGNGFVTIAFLFSPSGPYKLLLQSSFWRFNHSNYTCSFSWSSSYIIAMHFTAQQYAKSMHLIILSVIYSSHCLFVNSFIDEFLQEELLRLIKHVEQTSGMHPLLSYVTGGCIFYEYCCYYWFILHL